MANNSEILDLTADVVPSLSSSEARSLYASGSLNIRFMKQKKLYTKLLLGTATRPEVGEAPDTVYTSQDLQILTSSDSATISKFIRVFGSGTAGNPARLYVTGALFPVSSSVFRYPEQLATSPSWTQHNIGKNHAFVIATLSSSDHEVSRLNAFCSGQLPLEQSPVPASASVYYSKATRLIQRTYKLSASLNLPVNPPDIEQFPFDQEIVVARPVYDSTSGSYRAYSYFNPAVFEIDVPDYGRIRDVRVWVEFIHDVRLGTGSIGSTGPFIYQGLGAVQVALRSPNVTFRNAHPLWNDPQTKDFKLRQSMHLTGAVNQFADGRYNSVPELLRSSYLLWAGHNVDRDDMSVTLSDPSNTYISWDSDIDMRTVFWDGAPQFNTRHIDALLPAAADNGPGTLVGSVLDLVGPLSGGAPNKKAYSIESTAGFFSAPSAKGNNVPWMIDPRIKTGSLRSGDVLTNVLGLSPPAGWLTGPGGTADVGEFPTTGSNLGPATIRPMYPILDDVFVEKKTDDTATAGYTQYALSPTHGKLVGFRPGLRGTEIHGKWKLLIGMGTGMNTEADFDTFEGMKAHRRAGLWFRQFRIEFIVDQGPEVESFYPSKNFRFKRPAYVPQRPGRRRVQIISGTASWDIGVNYVQTEVRNEYGRTSGITSDKSSSIDSFAIFSQITGSFADYLTGSVFTQGAFYTYLHNEFGTPFIPISSGSGVTPSFETFDPEDAQATRDVIVNVLHPGPVIHQQDTIYSYAARNDFVQDRRSIAATTVASSFLRSSLLLRR